MRFMDFGGTLVDIDEIAAVQTVYGGGLELTLRGGGVVKLSGNAKLDGKPVLEALLPLLTTHAA